MTITKTLLISALGAAALLAAPVAAVAGPVGQLYCNVSGGVGLIITSRRALNCEYTPANGALPQHYVGTISRFGLDIGPQGPGKLTWDVVSLGGAVGPGSLAGGFHRCDRFGNRRRRGRRQCAGRRRQRRHSAAAALGRGPVRAEPRRRRRRTVARLRPLMRLGPAREAGPSRHCR